MLIGNAGARPNLSAVRRIKRSLRTALALPEEALITVTQLACLEEACAPLETVIGLLRPDAPQLQHKVHKATDAVDADDLMEVCAAWGVSVKRSELESHSRRVRLNTEQKVPVTILTGFLGSGKTTLLNRILSEEHGKRIAVIENEYGEVGIDQALVINADEEIFEMSNGCICCTVRGDLIRVLGNLLKRRDKFDYVLVETTGWQIPASRPDLFMDDEIRAEFALDGIVTLVDAAHIGQQLGEVMRAPSKSPSPTCLCSTRRT